MIVNQYEFIGQLNIRILIAVEHIKMQYILIAFQLNIFQKKITNFWGNKNIMTHIYKIHAFDSIMSGYFCLGFIDFMVTGKSLVDYSNLFSPNFYDKK